MITIHTLPDIVKNSTLLMVVAATMFGPHMVNTVTADSPNIILILTDDQGWSQRSGLMDPENAASGSNYLHTPARIG